MPRNPIHQLLRANREAAGLSQAALAARMSTTQSVVARAESGRGPAHTISFLERFASATGRALTMTIVPGEPAPPSREELHRHARRIRDAATIHGIHDVRVVGSVARDMARADSDVDLLVAVSPRLTGAQYFVMLDAFREACIRIVRRPVDVIDVASVRERTVRDRLHREARRL